MTGCQRKYRGGGWRQETADQMGWWPGVNVSIEVVDGDKKLQIKWGDDRVSMGVSRWWMAARNYRSNGVMTGCLRKYRSGGWWQETADQMGWWPGVLGSIEVVDGDKKLQIKWGDDRVSMLVSRWWMVTRNCRSNGVMTGCPCKYRGGGWWEETADQMGWWPGVYVSIEVVDGDKKLQIKWGDDRVSM